MEGFKEQIRVKLELFEGPLDLLLHLITTQHIDISEIPISKITEQYLETLEIMKELDLDIAGDYLVMASTLTLIKSRMLLPPAEGDDIEKSAEELKEELIRRLKKYSLFKKASQHLEELGEQRDQLYFRESDPDSFYEHTEWVMEASLGSLLEALKGILDKHKDPPVHLVKPSPVSVRQKMNMILVRLQSEKAILFSELFAPYTERREIIGVFLAILELIKMQAIQARQRNHFTDIRIVSCSEDEKAGSL